MNQTIRIELVQRVYKFKEPREDILDCGVTKNMALNMVDWKNSIHSRPQIDGIMPDGPNYPIKGIDCTLEK